MIRWKPSRESFVDSHCGQWHISPKYWGRVKPVDFELRRGPGRGEYIGSFDTQKLAKLRAEELITETEVAMAAAARKELSDFNARSDLAKRICHRFSVLNQGPLWRIIDEEISKGSK